MTTTEPRYRFALRNLRHLYEQMLAPGAVRDTESAARGLLGPAIEMLETECDALDEVAECIAAWLWRQSQLNVRIIGDAGVMQRIVVGIRRGDWRNASPPDVLKYEDE